MNDWQMTDVLMLFWDCVCERESDLMCGDFQAINDDLRLIHLAKAWLLHTLNESWEGV